MGKEIGQKFKRLRLAWLGTPVISYADQPVTFRTRKALALLIYLATEGGTHTREKLTTLFWPESDSERGRGMLRNTLAYLREVMDTFDIAHLKVERNTLGFDFTTDVMFDLRTVQTALNVIEQQPDLAGRERVISQLQTAANLYRGDFLEGFSLADTPDFDDWVSLQREVWHGRMNLLFDALSQLQFERGDLLGGIETATRWSAHDLYGEAAPQRLMELHFAAGNRTAALQVYEAYCQMLAAEFGAGPAPEIKTLAARIRASVPPQQPPMLLAPPSAAVDVTFVGRTTEYNRLITAYHAAGRGQTQVIILAGEAGIGKTRLATEFLHWATAQGAEALPGRTFESEGELPYQPVAQLLRHRLEQEQFPTALLSETWLAELSRLLPELRDRYPELPPPQPDDAAARNRLFEAITRLGQALAKRAPLLLFIDDIQWADSASLDTLHYAVSRWAENNSPVLVLLCLRDTSLVTKSNVQQWLNHLKARLPVSQLALDPLTSTDTLALVASLEAGQPASEGADDGISPEVQSPAPKFKTFAQALFAETNGQPLYIVETIKALLEQKILIPYQTDEGIQGLKWSTLDGETSGQFSMPRIIPTGIREAILDRVSRLTPMAATMLTTAAVLGQAASFKQLAEMSGADETGGVEALEELLSRRFLLETRDASQPYLLVHDKIRDVIYAEASSARKQMLHRRAVTVLQSADPARLAYHALAAGMNEEAFHYSLAAGNAALHLYAANETIAHLETARQIMAAGSLPEPAEADCRQLYLGLGRALELNGQFEQALATYTEMEAMAERRNIPALKLAALMAQATLQAMPSQALNPIQGEAVSEQALALARNLGDQAAETKILWNLSNLYRLYNRLPQAIDYGERSLTLARDLTSATPAEAQALREQMAFTLTDLANCYCFRGHLLQATVSYREAGNLWRTLNNLPMLADSLSGLTVVAVYNGDYDLALTASDEATQISQSIGNIWGQSYSKVAVGHIYWDWGQPDQAITEMQECLRLSELANYVTPQVYTRAELAVVYGSLGAFERGLEIALLALTVAETQIPLLRPYALARLAQLHLWQGNLIEAEAIINRGNTDPNREAASSFFQFIILTDAELALKQGTYERALTVTNGLLATLRDLGMRAFIPHGLYLQGRALLGLGQEKAARDVLLEARTEAEAINSRRLLWQILATLAGLETNLLKAEYLRHQAREIIEYIVDHTPPELRASFLGLLAIQKLLNTN